ncbi:glycosyltransferase [Solirhodobacter olei]|uniref:glycosyltransferase n=1 Tax=Solirhodobacter olei TaxID=2493082 RepID=UPI000FDA7F8F|nr:glycosyltransferase [Solirhodobacter olei]
MTKNASSARTSIGRIAYLTGEYPRATDTFIQREVAALRELGLEVHTCSIRVTKKQHHVGETQRNEHARTFYVLRAAKHPGTLIVAHLEALMQSPSRWFSALRLAWTTRPPGAKALIWQLFYFLEAAVLARHLRQVGATHLHNHFGDASCSTAMLTSEMSGIPFSFTLHGPAIFFEPKWWRIDEKIARARFVACISHFCRSQAMLFSDQAHWGKLRIVHCGVISSRYGTAPRKIFGRHIIFVGRLDRVKGATLLLDAFALLRRKWPDTRISFVGDGADRATLETQAAELGLGTSATFHGYRDQDEVAKLLEAADMLVLPSFAEGLPVVLMEAMASGIPVVASQLAGVPELVRDGVSGFIVPPGDAVTLTERLERLLRDPELCRHMGEAGRATVATEFDSVREATWLRELFEGTGKGLRPGCESKPDGS